MRQVRGSPWLEPVTTATILGMATRSIAEILELDLADRLQLVQAIWDSIADAPESVPLTDAERAELDRRLDDYYAQPKGGSPWSEVKARILRDG